MSRLSRFAARCALALLALTVLSARAGDGHDHGEAPAAAAGPAAPRFAAVSELFELVGVLDGDRVTFYLDRYADNSPVEQAELEIEFDGRKLALDALGSGVFETDLGAVPGPGVIAVTATVSAGEETDLLAGEFDLHGPEAAGEAAHAYDWGAAAAGFGAGVLALGALVVVLRGASAGKGVAA